MNKRYDIQCPNAGLTLLEMAIVLIIVGLLIGGVLKGRELIEESRLRKTASQIESIRTAIEAFRATYHEMPGSFVSAKAYLGPNVKDGSGEASNFGPSSLDPNSDGGKFWDHLKHANLLNPNSSTKSGVRTLRPALGGVFSVEHKIFQDRTGVWLVIGEEDPESRSGRKALLTPAKARALINMLNQTLSDSECIATEGCDAEERSCMQDRTHFSNKKSKKCIVYIFLWD